MKKTLLTILTIFLLSNSYAQGFINTRKTDSKNYLLKYIAKEKVQTITTETDSTLTFLIRDSVTQNLDLSLHFDAFGKCDRELRLLSCDSCYQKILSGVLADKNFSWIKIDDTTYVSKYSKQLILNMLPGHPFSFLIQRNNISRKAYKQRYRKV